MSKRVVLLFAGQGAQDVGMARDLIEAHPVTHASLEAANQVLGFDLGKTMFSGPLEELTRTSRCQPALYFHGLLCWDLLKERVPGLEVAGAAGLSLGEFTAHAAAGTFGREEGLRLVLQRGAFMEEATGRTQGTMAAMIGGEEDAVRALAEACDVDVANYNSPGQIVLSGTREGIAKAVAGAKACGIKIAKELTVAGAYHSRLMRSAQEALGKVLLSARLKSPVIPVVSNYLARPVRDPDEIRASLEAQVTGSVRWTESMRVFLDQGERTFIELGPGGVLAGLMKRIDREAKVISVTDVPSLEAAVAALNQ